jgi:hypothetical protein
MQEQLKIPDFKKDEKVELDEDDVSDDESAAGEEKRAQKDK